MAERDDNGPERDQPNNTGRGSREPKIPEERLTRLLPHWIFPTAFLEAFRGTSVSCSPGDVAAVTSAGMLIDSPRRQMI